MERDVGSRIPALCIGGISPQTLSQVLAAGAQRIVVVSALLQAGNPQAETRRIRDALSAASPVAV